MLRFKEFWLHLDPYTANKLLAKKPDGEREFSESMHRFEIAKGHLSDALETMRGKLLDSTRKIFEGTFILAEYAHQICRCLHKLSFKKNDSVFFSYVFLVWILLLRYTDLAIARRDLESSQLGAAWEHFSKCRPLSKKYGLYLPCHENFKTAMRDLDFDDGKKLERFGA